MDLLSQQLLQGGIMSLTLGVDLKFLKALFFILHQISEKNAGPKIETILHTV